MLCQKCAYPNAPIEIACGRCGNILRAKEAVEASRREWAEFPPAIRKEFEEKLDKVDTQLRKIDRDYNPLSNEVHGLELEIQRNELDIQRLEEELLGLKCERRTNVGIDEVIHNGVVAPSKKNPGFTTVFTP